MFVEEYLQDLRKERFAPRALAGYGRRVFARVQEHLWANPSAVRSIWSVGLGFFAGAFLVAVALALGYDRRLAYDFFLRTSWWILPAFGFVTLNVEHMRDREGYRLSALNVPTLLTLLRVAMVPGIALFLLDRHFVLALITFILAALSDVADGWLARRWKQETKLGRVLDPIVDVVFNLAVFFALAASGLLPAWVFGVTALRYGILLVGGASLTIFVGPLRIRPTSFGRATGVMTSVLVALQILVNAMPGRFATVVAPLNEIALGVLMSGAVIQVLLMGWYNLKVMTGEAARTRGRVVGDVRWGAQ